MARMSAGMAGWGVAGLLLFAVVSQCGSGDGSAPTSANQAATGDRPDEAAPVQKTVYVRAASLNCRAGRTTSSEAVERLPDRLRVGVVREADGWSLLDRDNACWVRSSYLGPSPRPPEPVRALSGYDGARRPARVARATSSTYYANCSAARAAGAAPVLSHEPGYARRLDRDGDGIGCE